MWGSTKTFFFVSLFPPFHFFSFKFPTYIVWTRAIVQLCNPIPTDVESLEGVREGAICMGTAVDTCPTLSALYNGVHEERFRRHCFPFDSIKTVSRNMKELTTRLKGAAIQRAIEGMVKRECIPLYNEFFSLCIEHGAIERKSLAYAPLGEKAQELRLNLVEAHQAKVGTL